jgi:hypothetical protein
VPRDRSRFHLIVLGGGLAWLAGCVAAPSAEDQLQREIVQHYGEHAAEEEGKCRTPKIDTIKARRVIESGSDGIERQEVQYSYFDRNADMDGNWAGLFHTGQSCAGTGSREFTILRTDLGYRVTAMSGEQRGGIAQNQP